MNRQKALFLLLLLAGAVSSTQVAQFSPLNEEQFNKLQQEYLDKINKEAQKYPLHHAARNNDITAAKTLLEKDPSMVNFLDTYNRTPLQRAVSANNLDMVKFLIDNGADVKAQSLHDLIWEDNLAIVKLLVEHGAKLNDTDNSGWTPLHIAAREEKADIAELLLKSGAEVNPGDNDGLTPLHQAAYTDNLKIIDLLIKHGANVNATGKYGATPLDIASNANRNEVVSYLRAILDKKLPKKDT